MQNQTTDIRIAVDEVLRAPYQRVIQCQSPNGRRFWLKRVERFAPHLWLVKGKPVHAFERDRRAHRFLWRYGMPVPGILAEGVDFIAVEDAGTSLTKLCASTSVTASEKREACRAAGKALALLHAADTAHGRPAFRDMCWDGGQVRFIDFECFVNAKAGPLRKARDVGIAVLSAFSQGADGPRYAFYILSAYRAAQSEQPKRLLPTKVRNNGHPIPIALTVSKARNLHQPF